MKFILSIDSANTLVRFAKGYIDYSLYVEKYKVAHCSISENKLTANLINAYSFAEITIPITKVENKENICFLPIPKRLFSKQDGVVSVLVEEDNVTYHTENGSYLFKITQSYGELTNIKGYWRESKGSTYFNPKLLINSLQPFANHKTPICIDWLGESNGVMISQSNNDEEYKSLVLPVKKPKGEK
ncbi:hypothetical protein AAK894_04455 [Lachnospiraceae bacterium 46-61]